MEEDIKILEEIIKGNEDCIEMISKFDSNNKKDDEDIEHYKREIRGIINIINSYKKEKARADKLEKEYSRMLTKIDEYEVNYIPISLVEEKIEEYFEDEEWLVEHDLRALCDDEKECREYYTNKKLALKDIKKAILDKLNKLLKNY